jgi:cytochrome b
LVSVARSEGNAAEHRGRQEGGAERTESGIGEFHDLLADITMALVVMHILGVALASFVHRENLVLAMITGRKRRAGD